MQAVILAGGFGTRLRPLTYTRSKSLLPILNKPMISYLVEALPEEVNRVIIAANYRKEQIEDFFERNRFGKEIIINEEPKPLGTGGAVKFAERYIDDRFLVLNSDIISSIDFDEMIGFHEKKGAFVTISLWPVENVSEFGVVRIEKDGRITEFVEKPKPEEAPSNLINAGAYCMERDALDYIDEPNRLISMEQEVFPRIIEDGRRFYGYQIRGFWMDVGRISSYIEVNRILLKMHNKRFMVGDNCMIKGDLEETSAGSNVEVGDGSRIRCAVILDNVKIGRNVWIENSVIGEGCIVGDGARIINCVIGDGEEIEGGRVLKDVRIWSKPIPEGYPDKQVGNIIKA